MNLLTLNKARTPIYQMKQGKNVETDMYIAAKHIIKFLPQKCYSKRAAMISTLQLQKLIFVSVHDFHVAFAYPGNHECKGCDLPIDTDRLLFIFPYLFSLITFITSALDSEIIAHNSVISSKTCGKFQEQKMKELKLRGNLE